MRLRSDRWIFIGGSAAGFYFTAIMHSVMFNLNMSEVGVGTTMDEPLRWILALTMSGSIGLFGGFICGALARDIALTEILIGGVVGVMFAAMTLTMAQGILRLFGGVGVVIAAFAVLEIGAYAGFFMNRFTRMFLRS